MSTQHAHRPATDTHAESGESIEVHPVDRWLAVTRIAIGFVFVWAFFDKLFGLHYSTMPSMAWMRGGSPTSGFLGHVSVGPFENLFRSWAGSGFLDWIFMLGLLGVGVAVMLGIAQRLSAVAGTVLLLLMWAAEWPLAMTTSAGQPSGSTNPIIDYHIIYALVLIVLAAHASRTWGLGRRWEQLPIVQRNRWMT